MSMSTYRGYGMRAPSGVFAATEPVSSWRARELRDNLLHFTDEYSQVRINWMTRDNEMASPLEGIEGTCGPDHIWCAEYPHTWLGPNKPANVDIYLQGLGANVWVRLVPASYDLGDFAAPAVFSEVIDMTGVTPVNATYTHQNDASSVAVFEQGWQYPVVTNGADGNPYPIRMCMMRLEITTVAEDASFDIWAVQLREFA